MKISDRAKRAALELTPEQLKFADLYLDRVNNGLSNAQCVLQAYPGHTTKEAAATTAYRLLSNTKVLNYLDAMGAVALESVGESLSSRVEWWKRAASTAEELLEPYCKRVIVPGEDNDEQKHLWVNSTDDIPNHLQQYVVRYKRYLLGGYTLETRELFDPKTRAKASENLDKITGNSVERVELSGTVGNLVQKVPEGASLEDIAQLYQKALK
ncbi:hypothetical protein NW995_002466 [Salmonella enterica]|nr:hypothetical protein [Salmonella enterica]ECL8515691.1 hypothetical protein [Salmonella enterica]EJS0970470.1 hypothetical protein [Salmonella enterica]